MPNSRLARCPASSASPAWPGGSSSASVPDGSPTGCMRTAQKRVCIVLATPAMRSSTCSAVGSFVLSWSHRFRMSPIRCINRHCGTSTTFAAFSSSFRSLMVGAFFASQDSRDEAGVPTESANAETCPSTTAHACRSVPRRASPFVAIAARRFGTRPFLAAQFVAQGALPDNVHHEADRVLQTRRNILVSGSTDPAISSLAKCEAAKPPTCCKPSTPDTAAP